MTTPTKQNTLTQSQSSPTWSYWESLGYSDEQPLKAEYFVKRMWPKSIPVKRVSQSEKEKLARGVLPAPLSLRRVQGTETTEFHFDTTDAIEEECATTEEDDSDYGEDPEIDLDDPAYARRIF